MLSLQQYQTQALQTAMPEAFNHDYLIPAIVGEVGELFGKRAKAVRDHWSPARLDDELAGEYGDVLWMGAVLLDCHEVHEIGEGWKYLPRPKDSWDHILRNAHQLYDLHTHGSRGSAIEIQAIRFWCILEQNCFTVTGHQFHAVQERNLAKLASRQDRGVITGSGDNR